MLAVDGTLVERPDQTTDLGPAPRPSPYTPLDIVPQWSRDGSSVLLAQPGGEVLVVPLEGDRRTLRVPPAASSIRGIGDDSIVFLLEDRLHAARFHSDPTIVAEGQLITNDAALYPAVARDGSVLYLSDDGLRVRRSDGSTVPLGWPIRFQTPTPSDLVIRNVRLVGEQAGASERSDIFVANGRIERLAPAGRVPVGADAQVVDAEGRFAIPGLIDLHQHPGSEAQLRGALYFGITTLRDMGNSIAIMAAWRDAVSAGAMPGPRLVAAGLMFYPGCVATGGAWCQFTEFEQSPSDDAVAARGLALAQASGIGTVKMYSPGSLAAGRRFVEMAHRLGLRVTGHSGHSLPLLAVGMDGKEHVGAGAVPPPWALHTELEELVASGLTPGQALAAATSTAARALGAERDIGTVAPGTIADLVILDADPLVDIRNTRKIWRVILGGRVVDRDALLNASRN